MMGIICWSSQVSRVAKEGDVAWTHLGQINRCAKKTEQVIKSGLGGAKARQYAAEAELDKIAA